MKRQMQSRHNSGFTLVETLAVVAIIIILLAVSSVPVAKHVNTLKVMELDNAARDIYMAAQNRAVLLSGEGSQQLDDLVKPGNSEARAVTLSSPQVQHKDEKNYCVTKDEAKGTLLLAGSIDDTLWDGDFYIVYDLVSGSVTDVFYAKEKLGWTDFATEYNTNFLFEREDRVKAKKFVGWYGGEAAKGKNSDVLRPDTSQNPYIDVEIENNEELTLTVTVKGEYVKYIKEHPDALVVRLGSAENDELTAENSIVLKNKSVNDTDVAAGVFTDKWVLDSLTEGNQFKNLKGADILSTPVTNYVTPGRDFKVVGTITTSDGEEYSDSDEDNSLFWNDYDAPYGKDDKEEPVYYNSNDETAYIKYLRHLQNLDAGNNGFDSEVTGKTKAVQVADIKDYYNTKYEKYNFFPIDNSSLTEYDGGGKIIEQLYVDHSEDNQGLFGINYGTITNVTVKGETNAGSVTGGTNVGCIAGDNKGTVKNCKNEGTPVNGTENVGGLVGSNNGTLGTKADPNTSSGNVTGTTSVGGIVGANAKDKTVDGDFNKIAGTITIEVKTDAFNVGGFVGYNEGTVTGCTRSETKGNIIISVTTGAKVQCIGGIVGKNYNSGKVLSCKNELFLDAGNNSMYVGGIVGDNDVNATVSSCTNGVENGNPKIMTTGNQYVGGIAGYNKQTIGTEKGKTTATACFNYANVTATVTSGNACVGGIAGESNSSTAWLADCENYGTVTSYANRAGGIVGSNSSGTVTGCTNGSVTTSTTVTGKQYVGGIVGYNDSGTVTGCTNEAKAAAGSYAVSGSQYVGGIVGSNTGTVGGIASGEACVNKAAVYASFSGGQSLVGGIVGESTGSGASVKNCTNEGDVTALGGSVAGIAGKNASGGTVGGDTDAEGCVNKATVTTYYNGGYTSTGGIVGENTGNGTSVKNCTNEGSVTATNGNRVGGVVGLNQSNSYVESCSNAQNARVTGNEQVSGVVGSNYGTVSGCHSDTARDDSGNTINDSIQGMRYIGGIVGNNYSAGQVKNCTNECDITVGENVTDVGGIAGNNFGTVGGTGTGEGCVNKATITSLNKATYSNVGGIVGCSTTNVAGGGAVGAVYNCVNQGDVIASDGARVGGIAGYCNGGNVQYCRNDGAKVEGKSNVGGIAGYLSARVSGDTIETSYNVAPVTGSENVGGVVGFHQSGEVKNCYNTGMISSASNVGGVTGVSYGILSHCYNIGSVTDTGTGTRYIGAVTGSTNDTTTTVTSCYYLGGTAQKGIGGTKPDEGMVEAKTSDEFADQATFQTWDFDNTWTISDNKGRPILKGNLET